MSTVPVDQLLQWIVELSNGDIISLLQYPVLAYLIRERITGHRQQRSMDLNLTQIHARLVNIEDNTRRSHQATN